MLAFLAYNMCYYCDNPAAIIFQPILLLFHFLFTSPVVYFAPLTIVRLFNFIWIIILMQFVLLVSAFGVSYISQLQAKISSTNSENCKLLDGMHEGVLIISQTTQKIIFCNKPAQQLLYSLNGEKKTDDQNNDK